MERLDTGSGLQLQSDAYPMTPFNGFLHFKQIPSFLEKASLEGFLHFWRAPLKGFLVNLL